MAGLLAWLANISATQTAKHRIQIHANYTVAEVFMETIPF